MQLHRPLPSFEHRIYPAHKVAALVSALVEKGVPAADALAGSGLQPSSHLATPTHLYGASFRLSQGRLSYPAPKHAPMYRKVFRCPVHFRQPVDELRFSIRWLAKPMPYADPITNAMAREMCQ